MSREGKCHQCGESFLAERSGSVPNRCLDCRPNPTLRCKGCGGWFRPKSNLTVRCNPCRWAVPCRVCSAPPRDDSRSRYCSPRCASIAHGQTLPEPYPSQVCALPECSVEFIPLGHHQRCCSQRHGKMLYNRESRADGRQQSAPWDDRRRDGYDRRRARKRGTEVVESFTHLEIFERDAWLCGICTEPVVSDLDYPDPLSASLDHVVPLSLGGAHTRGNVRCSHLRCNVRRGNRLDREAVA